MELLRMSARISEINAAGGPGFSGMFKPICVISEISETYHHKKAIADEVNEHGVCGGREVAELFSGYPQKSAK